MEVLLTKFFRFSASHAAGQKVYGHNYVLGVTVEPLSLEGEKGLEETVGTTLIDRLQSRDLGLHVDFLKGLEINDANLLRSFWKVLEGAVKPAKLRSLSLERSGARTTLSP